MIDPSNDWRALGAENPYFGVISNPSLDQASISDETKRLFFEGGRTHIKDLLSLLERRLTYKPTGIALDFGCGVGRLAFGLGEYFDNVVGVDISEGMLAEAERECASRQIKNCKFTTDIGSSQSFDFVHSFIVFQHIPVGRGLKVFSELVDALRPGGVGAIHITYEYASGKTFKNKLKQLVKKSPPLRIVANIAMGKSPLHPVMQMNNYNLPDLLSILANRGIMDVFLYRVVDWENIGAYLCFEKPNSDRKLWFNPANSDPDS